MLKSHLNIIFDFTCAIAASSAYFSICNLLLTGCNQPSSFQRTFTSITLFFHFLLFIPIQVVSLLSIFSVTYCVSFIPVITSKSFINLVSFTFFTSPLAFFGHLSLSKTSKPLHFRMLLSKRDTKGETQNNSHVVSFNRFSYRLLNLYFASK